MAKILKIFHIPIDIKKNAPPDAFFFISYPNISDIFCTGKPNRSPRNHDIIDTINGYGTGIA